MIQILIILTLFYCSSAISTYNVQSFGAKSDGKSDSTKAFLNAWGAACAATSPATIYVPQGRYLLQNAYFEGKSCKNTAITMRIDGTLVAPSDYNIIGKSGSWLRFERVTGVSIYGGTIDAQGTQLWACKKAGKACPQGATVRLMFLKGKLAE
ncbi:Polygalacturonase [Handroanthus impetiginosus]|uniref:Polygalacturonase n=1 Tax=Handroanthus impetiginosus TaxID=429701 RepID=A0A2G9FXF4_9LAMI|nr:Polygalacturonase [Handroanthus impetiginosus]